MSSSRRSKGHINFNKGLLGLACIVWRVASAET